ncbi:hypothetical protein [Rhodopirellula sp. MGV]|uniref:hypothetical protein n=1 Tax=Rhodopirellula sp. MGV TaxID=2023130 RepID=UPI000B96E4FF|nr:hypothetical protein [Rhodopirellula sp. MGV]
MRKSPRFSLSSLLLGPAFLAVVFAVGMNFGAFGLLVSAVLMLILLLIFAVSNLMNERSRTSSLLKSVAKLLVALYFASYGPATWLLATTHTYEFRSPNAVAIHYRIYSPVTRCIVDSPVKAISDVGASYLEWWLPVDVEFHRRGRYIGWYSDSKLNPSNGISIGITPPLISE